MHPIIFVGLMRMKLFIILEAERVLRLMPFSHFIIIAAGH